MTNGAGSILAEYGSVTGDIHITTNSLRKELESKVRGSHQMSTRSKDVTMHSQQVGREFYDKTTQEFRASSMFYINSREGNFDNDEVDVVPVPEEIQAKRARLESQAKEVNLQKAKETLALHQVSRKWVVGKNCTVLPSDREFLQRTLGCNGSLSAMNLHLGKFPGKLTLSTT